MSSCTQHSRRQRWQRVQQPKETNKKKQKRNRKRKVKKPDGGFMFSKNRKPQKSVRLKCNNQNR